MIHDQDNGDCMFMAGVGTGLLCLVLPIVIFGPQVWPGALIGAVGWQIYQFLKSKTK